MLIIWITLNLDISDTGDLVLALMSDSLEGLFRAALRNEVKAVAFHQFEVKKENGLWQATLIFDIENP